MGSLKRRNAALFVFRTCTGISEIFHGDFSREGRAEDTVSVIKKTFEIEITIEMILIILNLYQMKSLKSLNDNLSDQISFLSSRDEILRLQEHHG